MPDLLFNPSTINLLPFTPLDFLYHRRMLKSASEREDTLKMTGETIANNKSYKALRGISDIRKYMSSEFLPLISLSNSLAVKFNRRDLTVSVITYARVKTYLIGCNTQGLTLRLSTDKVNTDSVRECYKDADFVAEITRKALKHKPTKDAVATETNEPLTYNCLV